MNPNLSLLFDIDGTLTDTDSLHLEAFRALLRPFGRTVTEDAFRARVIGQPNDLIMAWMFPELDDLARAELADQKEHIFRTNAGTLTPTPGLTDLLAWAEENSVAIGVVTNAPRSNGELMLRGLGLDRFLPRLVIGPELAHAKPHPLPYLTGLALIGGHADRTIAFEDSVPGVTAAARAGLFTVGITTGMTADLLRQAGARQIVADFTDAALWDRLRAAASGQAPRGLVET